MTSPSYNASTASNGDLSPRSANDHAVHSAYEARKKLTEGVAWVYVPTVPSKPSEGAGPREVQFELRALADGAAALPVFTDQQMLVEQLGEWQPWEKIPVLELLIQISEAQARVVVNPVVEEDADRWTADRVETWRRENL
ncbi:SseB family protein [Actinoallomurus rhizosphaericola]|uniref:SseB family protein n=1 Tax=Actinoallomurus rhizosphaericola TaxID=2952536 RepID=UPI003872FA48